MHAKVPVKGGGGEAMALEFENKIKSLQVNLEFAPPLEHRKNKVAHDPWKFRYTPLIYMLSRNVYACIHVGHLPD